MKVIALFLVFAIFVVSSARDTDDEVNAKFESRVVKHGTCYKTDEEKAKRREIFIDNLRYIEDHNSAANYSYMLQLNQFADLTLEDYQEIYASGIHIPNDPSSSSSSSSSNNINNNNEVETSEHRSNYYSHLATTGLAFVDWRTTGALAAVKNQQSCGSSWAFATITAVEAINQIVTSRLITLSEQQLVDCTIPYGNRGCTGGWMNTAFNYIINNTGIDTDNTYPYKARLQQCATSKINVVVSVDGYRDVPKSDESALLAAVAQQPVVAAIDATQRNFMFYSRGIYYDPACTSRSSQAIVVVGYGTDNGKDYWIVRNSWGAKWGEAAGYIRILRERNTKNRSGACGITVGRILPNQKPSILNHPTTLQAGEDNVH